MGIISWIVLGLIAGIIAKVIMPGDDPGGFIVTGLIGIAGGFIGGIIGLGSVTGINIGSIILAVIGAVILLAGYRFMRKRAA